MYEVLKWHVRQIVLSGSTFMYLTVMALRKITQKYFKFIQRNLKQLRSTKSSTTIQSSSVAPQVPLYICLKDPRYVKDKIVSVNYLVHLLVIHVKLTNCIINLCDFSLKAEHL